MRRVRSADTRFEMRVRRLLHALGYRFRVHVSLPGRPDIVFTGRRKVIFCHGCFWHSHQSCKRGSAPKSKADFWVPKLERNKQRDEQNETELQALGWAVLVIWECELKDMGAIQATVTEFLGTPAGKTKYRVAGTGS